MNEQEMDRKLTEMLKTKGVIVKDLTNVNGRFVTVMVSSPRKVAWELTKEMPQEFTQGYFSKVPTYCGEGKYNVQANSKRPRLVLERAIYPAGSFGKKTEIYLEAG